MPTTIVVTYAPKFFVAMKENVQFIIFINTSMWRGRDKISSPAEGFQALEIISYHRCSQICTLAGWHFGVVIIVGLDQRSYATAGPVRTEMGDRVPLP